MHALLPTLPRPGIYYITHDATDAASGLPEATDERAVVVPPAMLAGCEGNVLTLKRTEGKNLFSPSGAGSATAGGGKGKTSTLTVAGTPKRPRDPRTIPPDHARSGRAARVKRAPDDTPRCFRGAK